MADDSTKVDVLSLEDFHATLASRLSEIQSIQSKMDGMLGDRMRFGALEDANLQGGNYDSVSMSVFDKVNQLHDAIVAAQAATSTIIANYRSTEERNRANSADIANQLGGISTALGEGQLDG